MILNMLIYESKTFFGILVSINILDMNISKEILLIVVLLSIYIIDGVIKKFNSWITSNNWFFLLLVSLLLSKAKFSLVSSKD